MDLRLIDLSSAEGVLRSLGIPPHTPILLVWAAPPCTEFSTARTVKVANPSLELLGISKKVIDLLNPRWWVIENVRGACKHFLPILGSHRQRIGPFFLWGRFPMLPISSQYMGRARSTYCPDGGDGHWRFASAKFGLEDYNKWDTPNNAAYPKLFARVLVEEITTTKTLEGWI